MHNIKYIFAALLLTATSVFALMPFGQVPYGMPIVTSNDLEFGSAMRVDSAGLLTIYLDGEVFWKEKNLAATTFTLGPRVGEHLSEITYTSYDVNAASNYYANLPSGEIPRAMCSAVRNGNFYGRNLDYFYDDTQMFVIRVTADPVIGRHASIGLAGGVGPLTAGRVMEGVADEAYARLPYATFDGINDAGVFCNANVTHMYDDTWRHGDNPTYSAFMAVRFVLDKFSNAREAADWIVANVWMPEGGMLGSSFHWFVGDDTSTYLVEDGVVTEIPSPGGYMTNFHSRDWLGHGTLSASDYEAINETDPFGCGLERWNRIAANYASASTESGMVALMRSLKYSQTYISGTSPFWYSEYVGVYSNATLTLADCVSGDQADIFYPYIAAGEAAYAHRHFGDGTWHTVHTAVYDISNRKITIYPWETDTPYVCWLDDSGRFATKSMISGNDHTFSNAVLSVAPNFISYARRHDILCGEPVVQFVDKTHVRVVGDISVIVNGKPVYIPQDVTVARGTVEKGRDYAVTLSQDGAIAVEPYDYDTAEIEPSRRILGGFHTICRNVPADYQKPPVVAFGGALHELAGWSEGDILPKSVWAMNFRPTAADPTGMVYAKECDRWIDIYNGSGTIAAPKSRFGGTRLHTHTAVEFMTGYGNVGKWLLTDESFWFAAVGSNCGTKVKGAAQPNPDTTGAHLDTADNPMISSIGCEECCGLQGQWLGDFSANSGGSWDYASEPTKAFDGNANAFGSHFNMNGYRAVVAGGIWTTPTVSACGPLCRSAYHARSNVDVGLGGRGSSRSTHPGM